MTQIDKCYIGDGVYVDNDGFQIRLYTFDGITEGNPIYIEWETFERLKCYTNTAMKWINTKDK